MQNQLKFGIPSETYVLDPYFQIFHTAHTFHQKGKLSEAKMLYEEILVQDPTHFDALHLSGVLLKQLGQLDAAEEFYLKALRIRSDDAVLYSNYGLILHLLKRFNEALESHDKALFIKSDFADAFYNRGISLQELRRLDEAMASYDAAISFKPDYAGAFNNRGNILYELHRFDEALESYHKAIVIKPDFADALNNYGTALKQMKRLDEAMASYDAAISLKPDYAGAFNNRGNTLYELHRFDEALESYHKAIAIQPDYAEVFNNYGNTLKQMKRFDEALEAHNKAITFKPDYADAYFDKALICLLLGDFVLGFHLYEWRNHKKELRDRRFYSQPLWLGQSNLLGKKILIHHEQGLGDTIQFCRYVPMLASLGASVLFAPQKRLKRLMLSLGQNFKIVDVDDISLDFDYQCPLLSLPLAFKTNLATIPNKNTYLSSDPYLKERWEKKLGKSGFKIGICWQGSFTKIGAGRSFALRQFELLSAIPGVRLISLHKGDGESQLKDLPRGMVVETLGGDFDAGPDGFVDTAAVIMCCDLVITSDTSIAHLSGALGVKTWVALKYLSDWRWTLNGDDSPWYPTMQLFRQHSIGDWDGVFSEIRNALVNLLFPLEGSEFASEPPPSSIDTRGSVSDHKKVFNLIYERNAWGVGSGVGSTPANTESYRGFLSNFLMSNRIKSVVDLGCGDWQFTKLIDWGDINYIGIDVSDVVLNNTKCYASDQISFLEMDALTGDLPSADLLLVKDVVQHWSNADILSFFPKLNRYKRALITNGLHPSGSSRTNSDISTGEWRPVDLKMSPFSLKGDYIYWYSGGDTKWVFLWQCES